jgi:hypothetical protein
MVSRPGGLNEAPRDLASSGRDLKLQLVGDDAPVGAITEFGDATCSAGDYREPSSK